MEKMLQRMAVMHLSLYIGIKGEAVRGFWKSTGDRLGRWGKAKPAVGRGYLWDWIRGKRKRQTHPPFTWGGGVTGQLAVNN